MSLNLTLLPRDDREGNQLPLTDAELYLMAAREAALAGGTPRVGKVESQAALPYPGGEVSRSPAPEKYIKFGCGGMVFQLPVFLVEFADSGKVLVASFEDGVAAFDPDLELDIISPSFGKSRYSGLTLSFPSLPGKLSFFFKVGE